MMTQSIFFCPAPTFVVGSGRQLFVIYEVKCLIGMSQITLKLDGVCQCVLTSLLSLPETFLPLLPKVNTAGKSH